MFDIKVGDRVRLTGTLFKSYIPEEVERSERGEISVTRVDLEDERYPRVWIINDSGDEESYYVSPGWDMELFEEETTQVDNPKHMVESPSHYTRSKEGLGLEVWDILDFFFPDDPHLWNVGKYLFRAGHKDDFVQDLEKLKQYVDRRIEKHEATGR